MKLKEKRGDLLFEQVIFIVLNLLFIFVMLAFIYRASSGAAIYEESYAKQIALMIDEAKPGMTMMLGMHDGISIANKAGKKEGIVKIDVKKHEVLVSLSDKGGYLYKYFSDYNIDYRIERNNLILTIGEKKDV
jgi:hypothetical protein